MIGCTARAYNGHQNADLIIACGMRSVTGDRQPAYMPSRSENPHRNRPIEIHKNVQVDLPTGDLRTVLSDLLPMLETYRMSVVGQIGGARIANRRYLTWPDDGKLSAAKVIAICGDKPAVRLL
jgi:thiamine pyrophosphate-dependent acetolactate synthase large subunit-like protein